MYQRLASRRDDAQPHGDIPHRLPEPCADANLADLSALDAASLFSLIVSGDCQAPVAHVEFEGAVSGGV